MGTPGERLENSLDGFSHALTLAIDAIELDIREHSGQLWVFHDHKLERLTGELKRPGLEFAPATLAALRACRWPGNVRHLRNVVERMAVLAPGMVLTPELLPAEVVAGPDGPALLESDLPYKEAVLAFKKAYVQRALATSGGNQTRAAEALGLRRSYLNRLIHGFDEDEPTD